MLGCSTDQVLPMLRKPCTCTSVTSNVHTDAAHTPSVNGQRSLSRGTRTGSLGLDVLAPRMAYLAAVHHCSYEERLCHSELH